MVLLDKPLQLPFTQQRINECQPSEIPHLDPPQLERIQHPVVLGVPIPILVRPQRVSDPFDRIDNRTTEVVSWVNLVFRSGTVVRQIVAAVDDGISHRLVGVTERDLGSDTPTFAFS